MSKLLLIRHGQARFLTDDYDRLSEQGEQQVALLGEHWARRGIEFDQAISGTLKRQQGTAAIALENAKLQVPVKTLPSFDEFPFDEIMKLSLPQLREEHAQIDERAREFEQAKGSSDRYRSIQRLLELVVEQLTGADELPEAAAGLPTWSSFVARVSDALAAICHDSAAGSNVAVFTSGGVVAVAVQWALRAPPEVAAQLCWRVQNASVTEFTFSGSRVSLDSFNTVEHLTPELRSFR
ncbi:MAG: histidine phosphatase family protein [Pseudomonadota bacterium]